MPSLIRKKLRESIIACLSIQAVIAITEAATKLVTTEYVLRLLTGIEAKTQYRIAKNFASPYYTSITISNRSPIAAIKAFKPQSALQFPNYTTIPNGSIEAKCLAYIAIASGTYNTTLTECTIGQAACTIGTQVYESVYVTITTYALQLVE